MEILYRDDAPLSAAAFVELYRSCSLGVRRPLDDPESVSAMMRHGSLMVTAWDGELIVGIARTLTDFAYVGYLADLAVRETHQKRGIGVGLIDETRRRMGLRCAVNLGRSAGRPANITATSGSTTNRMHGYSAREPRATPRRSTVEALSSVIMAENGGVLRKRNKLIPGQPACDRIPRLGEEEFSKCKRHPSAKPSGGSATPG